jgi:hypothetical protein
LHSIERKHASFSNGYTAKLRPDGLIVAAPRRVQSRISGRSLIVFVAAVLAFKGFLIASLGVEAYGDRVAKLQNGSALEAGGAFVMQADPASLWIAEQLGPVLR